MGTSASGPSPKAIGRPLRTREELASFPWDQTILVRLPTDLLPIILSYCRRGNSPILLLQSHFPGKPVMVPKLHPVPKCSIGEPGDGVSQLQYTEGFALDPEGNLYVADLSHVDLLFLLAHCDSTGFKSFRQMGNG